MVAAITAARRGAEVTVVEKNPRLGKKILSTGNGRCNFTNVNACRDSYNLPFAEAALSAFSPQNAMDFFEELGILSRIENEGRVYPNSGQASALLDVLRNCIERLGIKTMTEFDTEELKKVNGGFEIVSTDGQRLFAEKVIVATGGCAAPKTGSNGGGYRLLKALGHHITEAVPALAAVKTDRGIQGVRQYGKVTLGSGESRIGEIQFASSALSGIPVFGLARYAKKGGNIFVDLLPDYDEKSVVGMLEKRPSQPLESFLVGILNKTLGQMLLKECNVGALSRMSGTLKHEELEKIAEKLKNWRFEITGLSSWDNAQVTAGGIDTSEVNPETMESYIVQGVYITGELLDIDGDCGGYNLKWAWSSGFVAGGDAADVQN